MKFVREPKQEEVAYYTSDFSGQEFDQQEIPACEIKIECNYGSDYDGCKLTLHLTDSELEEVLSFIRPKLTYTTKRYYQHLVEEKDESASLLSNLLDGFEV
jgi:hypothetical protein